MNKLSMNEMEDLISNYFSDDYDQETALHLLYHYRDMLEEITIADERALAVALRAIAEYPNPGEGSMSAANMREIARAALASDSISGKCPPAPPAPPSLPYREVESGVINPQRSLRQQVEDARERVALWPQEKRDRMRLEGAERPSNEE